jgi:hypothetical protein
VSRKKALAASPFLGTIPPDNTMERQLTTLKKLVNGLDARIQFLERENEQVRLHLELLANTQVIAVGTPASAVGAGDSCRSLENPTF